MLTRTPPIHHLPEGYQEARHLVATDERTLRRLNMAAIGPIILTLLLMGWWGPAVRGMRGEYNTAFSESLPGAVAVIGGIILTLILHEGLHGLAIWAYGHQPRFGMALNKGVLYATTDNALFPRNQFIVIALVPLLGLTLLGMALIYLLPDRLGYYVGLMVVLNAGGAIGDLWMSWEVMRYPADALVRDEADSIRIYTYDASN